MFSRTYLFESMPAPKAIDLANTRAADEGLARMPAPDKVEDRKIDGQDYIAVTLKVWTA